MSGFEIDGVHTWRDLGLCCASRSISPPVKKTAVKSVPYMDGQLDFSQLGGRAYFEARTLSFAFDLMADTPQDLERQVTGLREFCAFTFDADIYDDDAPYFHYHGSFSEMEESPDEYGLSSEVTVSFVVDPYKVSNDWCEQPVNAGVNTVRNDGAWARLMVVPSGTVTIQTGSLNQTFSGETVSDIPLEHGENRITVTGGSAVLKWRERRL